MACSVGIEPSTYHGSQADAVFLLMVWCHADWTLHLLSDTIIVNSTIFSFKQESLKWQKRQNFQLDLHFLQPFDTYLTVYDFFSWNLHCTLWNQVVFVYFLSVWLWTTVTNKKTMDLRVKLSISSALKEDWVFFYLFCFIVRISIHWSSFNTVYFFSFCVFHENMGVIP